MSGPRQPDVLGLQDRLELDRLELRRDGQEVVIHLVAYRRLVDRPILWSDCESEETKLILLDSRLCLSNGILFNYFQIDRDRNSNP